MNSILKIENLSRMMKINLFNKYNEGVRNSHLAKNMLQNTYLLAILKIISQAVISWSRDESPQQFMIISNQTRISNEIIWQ